MTQEKERYDVKSGIIQAPILGKLAEVFSGSFSATKVVHAKCNCKDTTTFISAPVHSPFDLPLKRRLNNRKLRSSTPKLNQLESPVSAINMHLQKVFCLPF